jgi:hypothetical protein
MNHWIFVITEDEGIFKKRIENKTWPISRGTKHQTYLTEGDSVIFYHAGMDRKRFLGTASLKSPLMSIPNKIDSCVEIDMIELLMPPLSIRGLLPDLKFIKNKDYWSLYLHGGIIKLDEDDYSFILNAAKILKTIPKRTRKDLEQ